MKIIRNNIIPFKGFRAITIFWWIFVRGDETLSIETVNHEETHYYQQVEVTTVSFLVLLFLHLIGILSGWWIFLCIPSYFVLYFIEWVIRLIMPPFDSAYRSISFEREAFDNEKYTKYNSTRAVFAWVKYIF